VRVLLIPLLQLQRFFIPTLFVLLGWAIWRTIFRKDLAVGLALYACLIIVVDGFYNTGIYIPGLAKGSLRYSEVCAIVLLLHCPRPPRTGPIPRGLLFLVSAYFVLMLIAALRTNPLSQGLFDYRRIMIPQILALVLAARGLATVAQYQRFLLCLAVLVLLVGIFCFWDVFFDINILHSNVLYEPEYFHNRKLGRFGSLLLNPNLLGAFVVLLFPPMLALFLQRSGWRVRLYLGAALLGMLFCLVQTQSRAPLAVFAGTLAIFVFGPLGGMSRMRRFFVVIAAAAALAIFMPGFIKHAVQRFDTLKTEESEESVSRAAMWPYTEDLILSHPFLGIGFGESQFLAAMDQTDFRERYGQQSLDNPHNSYLQAAVYAGIPALALFLLANLTLLFKSWTASRRAKRPDVPAAEIFGLAVGITGLLVCMYPDMHLFTSTIAPLYWLFFGLLLSMLPSTGQVRAIAVGPAVADSPVAGYPAPGRRARAQQAQALALGGAAFFWQSTMKPSPRERIGPKLSLS
jgi:O-antigen ligase